MLDKVSPDVGCYTKRGKRASEDLSKRRASPSSCFNTHSISRKSMVNWKAEYLAAGGNRHPSAADWDLASGLLAFGADRNVAIWSPLV